MGFFSDLDLFAEPEAESFFSDIDLFEEPKKTALEEWLESKRKKFGEAAPLTVGDDASDYGTRSTADLASLGLSAPVTGPVEKFLVDRFGGAMAANTGSALAGAELATRASAAPLQEFFDLEARQKIRDEAAEKYRQAVEELRPLAQPQTGAMGLAQDVVSNLPTTALSILPPVGLAVNLGEYLGGEAEKGRPITESSMTAATTYAVPAMALDTLGPLLGAKGGIEATKATGGAALRAWLAGGAGEGATEGGQSLWEDAVRAAFTEDEFAPVDSAKKALREAAVGALTGLGLGAAGAGLSSRPSVSEEAPIIEREEEPLGLSATQIVRNADELQKELRDQLAEGEILPPTLSVLADKPLDEALAILDAAKESGNRFLQRKPVPGQPYRLFTPEEARKILLGDEDAETIVGPPPTFGLVGDGKTVIDPEGARAARDLAAGGPVTPLEAPLMEEEGGGLGIMPEALGLAAVQRGEAARLRGGIGGRMLARLLRKGGLLPTSADEALVGMPRAVDADRVQIEQQWKQLQREANGLSREDLNAVNAYIDNETESLPENPKARDLAEKLSAVLASSQIERGKATGKETLPAFLGRVVNRSYQNSRRFDAAEFGGGMKGGLKAWLANIHPEERARQRFDRLKEDRPEEFARARQRIVDDFGLSEDQAEAVLYKDLVAGGGSLSISGARPTPEGADLARVPYLRPEDVIRARVEKGNLLQEARGNLKASRAAIRAEAWAQKKAALRDARDQLYTIRSQIKESVSPRLKGLREAVKNFESILQDYYERQSDPNRTDLWDDNAETEFKADAVSMWLNKERPPALEVFDTPEEGQKRYADADLPGPSGDSDVQIKRELRALRDEIYRLREGKFRDDEPGMEDLVSALEEAEKSVRGVLSGKTFRPDIPSDLILAERAAKRASKEVRGLKAPEAPGVGSALPIQDVRSLLTSLKDRQYREQHQIATTPIEARNQIIREVQRDTTLPKEIREALLQREDPISNVADTRMLHQMAIRQREMVDTLINAGVKEGWAIPIEGDAINPGAQQPSKSLSPSGLNWEKFEVEGGRSYWLDGAVAKEMRGNMEMAAGTLREVMSALYGLAMIPEQAVKGAVTAQRIASNVRNVDARILRDVARLDPFDKQDWADLLSSFEFQKRLFLADPGRAVGGRLAALLKKTPYKGYEAGKSRSVIGTKKGGIRNRLVDVVWAHLHQAELSPDNAALLHELQANGTLDTGGAKDFSEAKDDFQRWMAGAAMDPLERLRHGRTASLLSRLGGYAHRVWAAGDNLPRALAWYRYMRKEAKRYELSPDVLEEAANVKAGEQISPQAKRLREMAGFMVNHLDPTYDHLPLAVRILRGIFFMASFPSWDAEVLRTEKNWSVYSLTGTLPGMPKMVDQSGIEMPVPKPKRSAASAKFAQQGLGFAFASVFSGMALTKLIGTIKGAVGGDEDDEDKKRFANSRETVERVRGLQSFSQNAQQVFAGTSQRKEANSTRYIVHFTDLNYANYWSSYARATQALLRGIFGGLSPFEAIEQSASELTDPYANWSMSASAVLEGTQGARFMDKTGKNRIPTETENDPVPGAVDAALNLAEKTIPGAAKEVQALIQATELLEQVGIFENRRGKKPLSELSNLVLGVKANEIDVIDFLDRKYRSWLREKSSTSPVISQIRRGDEIFGTKAARARLSNRIAERELRRAFEDAVYFLPENLQDPDEVWRLLRDNGVSASREDVQRFMTGAPVSLPIDKLSDEDE